MRQLSDEAIKAEADKWADDYSTTPAQRLGMELAFVAGYKLARDHAAEDSRRKATTSEALYQ